jgi:predicted secreted protein
MAATAGIGGSVKLGANVVADINNWSVSPKGAIEDTTAFGASGSWRTKVATVKEWSAKFDGFTNAGDTNGQLALINGLNATFTFNFMINGTNQWSGTGILSGIDPKSSATGLNEISFSVDGTGALTYS